MFDLQMSTLLHLRIPFSYFLLPVYLFAFALVPVPVPGNAWAVFFILHLLIYPASNGYNSFFDRDEGPIGGLKNPPKVQDVLYWVALLFDVLGLVWAYFLSPLFAVMVLIYGLVSKAYSHPLIRLKKYAIVGWLAAGVFQGYFTFLMCYHAISPQAFDHLWNIEVQAAAILTSMLLFGSYPMTQVYQHDEDGKRGDHTMSLRLGIIGTFHFTAGFFIFAVIGFAWYFIKYFTHGHAFLFVGSLLPVLSFFARWYFLVRRDVQKADFQNTMRLNFISATCLNLFFIVLALQ